ncbi:peptide/nickel transport system permease protein [Thermomonospora echinospora]|uniref:Peptide/nickel transport system permease protein n=1 Tax=Thermomonospora echinospora TaxID=1992 RepID=A0A1H6DYZ4_9ACTN|nr:ABC transporter permease [Thermomonospora echinospora]SEG90391.1 peptide/nickel transport system permease protein [Thermomonospora echinospora]
MPDTKTRARARGRLGSRRVSGQARYIIRRVYYAVFVVWAAYTITWLLLFLMPSNAAEVMLRNVSGGDSAADRAAVAALEHRYGLDRPPHEQYLTLLFRAVKGDFGISTATGRPVIEVIGQALPGTIQLGLAGLVLGTFLGLGIALAANAVRAPFLRNLLFSLPPLFSSLPAFFVGLLLVQFFAFGLKLLPAAGAGTAAHLVLPAITIAIPVSAGIAQVTAKSLVANLRSPYADYLRAKGVPHRRILLTHAFRNAIIPATTLLGMSIGGILAGAVVVETVFSRQGLGRLMQTSVTLQDIPVVQGVVVFSAVLYAAANLLVDLVYPKIDPRISIG